MARTTNSTISPAFRMIRCVPSSITRSFLDSTSPAVQSHDTPLGGLDQGSGGEWSEVTGGRSQREGRSVGLWDMRMLYSWMVGPVRCADSPGIAKGYERQLVESKAPHWLPRMTSVIVKGRKRWYNRRPGETTERHALRPERGQLQRSDGAVGQVAAADRVGIWEIRNCASN